jgi:hypothetical protein
MFSASVDAPGSYAEKLSSKNMVLSLASNGGNPSIAKLIANLGASRDFTKDLSEWIDSIICASCVLIEFASIVHLHVHLETQRLRLFGCITTVFPRALDNVPKLRSVSRLIDDAKRRSSFHFALSVYRAYHLNPQGW